MDNLILFRNLKHEDILRDVCALEGKKPDDTGELKSSVTARLVDLAVKYGFEGNIWHCFLTYTLINNENPYTLNAERRGAVGGTLEKTALHDMHRFRTFFRFDKVFVPEYILGFELNHSKNEGEIFNKRIRDRIVSLAEKLATESTDEAFLSDLNQYYHDYGVGKYGQHKAFRIRQGSDEKLLVEPISRVKHVYLEDLVGIESQKKKLTDNTEAFLEGRPANNVLLYGDAGTGKSSCIKGILNRYFDDGLRIIEIYKHQAEYLNDVISEVKNRNYRFIIYMDDLSFEDSEVEYKYLKAVIEGGLEKKPDNILIYATSNRRHLIHEGFSDKLDRGITDDIHESDTVQEKLSLSARFGEKIYFGRPDKKEFNRIVLEIAKRRGLDFDDETLLKEANKWELSHGGMSGRTAEQFIDHMEGIGIDR